MRLYIDKYEDYLFFILVIVIREDMIEALDLLSIEDIMVDKIWISSDLCLTLIQFLCQVF